MSVPVSSSVQFASIQIYSVRRVNSVLSCTCSPLQYSLSLCASLCFIFTFLFDFVVHGRGDVLEPADAVHADAARGGTGAGCKNERDDACARFYSARAQCHSAVAPVVTCGVSRYVSR